LLVLVRQFGYSYAIRLPSAFVDDGTLRLYDLSTFKVLKAVRGLGAEIASVVSLPKSPYEVFASCGQQVAFTLL
jgi:WD40 repeat protein